jgi:Predicted membrane protein (DUF2306)
VNLRDSKPSVLPAVALKCLTTLLLLKVTYQIVSNYSNYFPPNFNSAFLLGREQHFRGLYQLTFFAHIVASPLALLGGLILISERIRYSFPKAHRTIGKFQVCNVLLVVVPSGLWMSNFALTGHVAGLGFAVQAVATAVCTFLGWRLAVRKRFALHRRWMTRSFILLCSAVILRLVAGAATVLDWDAVWLYPLSAWMTWIVPLILYELYEAWERFRTRFFISKRHNI